MRKINLRNSSQIVISVLMLTIISLVGCQAQSFLDTVFPQQNIEPGFPQTTVIPSDSPKTSPATTPLPASDGMLSIWLPPQFGSISEFEAAAKLGEHLQTYLDENPKINLEVRVKPAAGPGSILETLSSASAVAPEALPSLVLLSRTEMVQAASQNLIFPMQELTDINAGNDLFDISKDLGTYQGTFFCLPFVIDALGLVQRDSGTQPELPSWDEAVRKTERLFFAAGDSEALITLALYLSAGGGIEDKTGEPVINTDLLTAVLTGYDKAVRSRRISPNNLEFQTDDQVWNALQSDSRASALTWVSHALGKEDEWDMSLLPGFGGGPFTLAKSWMWCLVEPHNQFKEESVRLAEYLIDADFLKIWSPISGYLPVRPSSISGYSNVYIQDTITTMLQSSVVRPEKTLTSKIGPELKTAVSEVLQKINSPDVSALNAEKRLEILRSQ